MNGKKVKRVRLGVIYLILGIIFVQYFLPDVMEFVDGIIANIALVFTSFASTPESSSGYHAVRPVRLTSDQAYYLELAKLLVVPVVIVAIVRIYVDRNKKD